MRRIGVVGCGLMGSGVAEVCARAGRDVVVCDSDDAALAQGRVRIERSLERAVKSGKVSAVDRESAFARIRFATDLEELADRELLIEAVHENEAAKIAVFEQLNELVQDANAIFASNTSSIPIMKLAVATGRPAQVCGLHFWDARRRSAACTSSTLCRCSISWSWSRRCSPATRRPSASRSSPRRSSGST
jgi:3-hydroxybutyryl-CoA dehydrogenase